MGARRADAVGGSGEGGNGGGAGSGIIKGHGGARPPLWGKTAPTWRAARGSDPPEACPFIATRGRQPRAHRAGVPTRTRLGPGGAAAVTQRECRWAGTRRSVCFACPPLGTHARGRCDGTRQARQAAFWGAGGFAPRMVILPRWPGQQGPTGVAKQESRTGGGGEAIGRTRLTAVAPLRGARCQLGGCQRTSGDRLKRVGQLTSFGQEAAARWRQL